MDPPQSAPRIAGMRPLGALVGCICAVRAFGMRWGRSADEVRGWSSRGAPQGRLRRQKRARQTRSALASASSRAASRPRPRPVGLLAWGVSTRGQSGHVASSRRSRAHACHRRDPDGGGSDRGARLGRTTPADRFSRFRPRACAEPRGEQGARHRPIPRAGVFSVGAESRARWSVGRLLVMPSSSFLELPDALVQRGSGSLTLRVAYVSSRFRGSVPGG